MRKRLLAGLLILCLLFACSSVGASGEVFNHQSGDYDFLPLEDGTACLVKYYGSEAVLTVPAELEGLKITEIADGAFSWNDDIENVILPEGVEKVGSQLFAYSTFLEAVTFPSTLKEISSIEKLGGADKVKSFLKGLGIDAAKVDAAVDARAAYETAVANSKDMAQFLVSQDRSRNRTYSNRKLRKEELTNIRIIL